MPLMLPPVVLDAPDARELADFYERLLGWRIFDESADWVDNRSPPGWRAVRRVAVGLGRRPDRALRLHLAL